MNRFIKLLCLNAFLIANASLAMEANSKGRNVDLIKQGEKLRNAAKKGKLKKVEKLLAAGVPVDAKRIDVNDGWTALVFAACRGHVEVCQKLLDMKAQVNAQIHGGTTALKLAAGDGNQKICKILIDANADVNIRTEVGHTALISAAYQGRSETCQLLIDSNAQIDAKDNDGWTTLRYAIASLRTDVCQLLVNAQIKQNRAKALALLGMKKFRNVPGMQLNHRDVIQIIARQVYEAEAARLLAQIYYDMGGDIRHQCLREDIRTYALQQLGMTPKKMKGTSNE
jgi:ankyrin repeat protein